MHDGTHIFSIAGADLGPDGTKADEYVALVSGKYTVKVYTSSGMGEDIGVACAMRKVMVA